MRNTTRHAPRATRRGFTLVELLVVIAIIGTLSTIATVSYTSSRMKARDARRLADMDVIRTALELYIEDYDGYPADASQGPEGTTLGIAGATKLTSGGWTDASPAPGGRIYLQPVPFNPPVGGADYIYYSLNRDGTDCDFAPCPLFRIEFALETSDTGDNGSPFISTPLASLPAPPEIAPRIAARINPSPGLETAASRVAPIVREGAAVLNSAREATVNNPAVQTAAESVVAPTSTTAVAISVLTGLSSTAAGASAGASAAAAASGASVAQTATTAAATAATSASFVGEIGALFYLLMTQPFMLLRKRKEYAWGVVYDSQKKLPLDLAIVRLIDEQTGRTVQTRVTDKAGRIFFFAAKGTYRLEVSKAGFVFPSQQLAGEREDGRFANLYFGQRFTVSESGQVINPSIPLDPAGVDVDDKQFVKHFIRNRLRYSISVAGLVFTMAAFAAKPSILIGVLFVVNLALYYVFRRITYPKQPAEWGTVKDEKTGRPVAYAVLRLFSTPYNKLVETRVADKRGRYNFMVGQNVYYLTATSKGYWKTESFPLDLRGSDKPQVIAAPLRLRPFSAEAEGRVDESGQKR